MCVQAESGSFQEVAAVALEAALEVTLVERDRADFIGDQDHLDRFVLGQLNQLRSNQKKKVNPLQMLLVLEKQKIY